MRSEIRKAAQFIINSYGGKYGAVDWSDCSEVVPFCINHTDGFTCRWKEWMVICFRGSHGDEDWQDNFTFNKQEMVFPGGRRVKVHTGFKTQYYTVQYYLSEIVQRYRDQVGEDAYILVCGHSLGGALASLCAADMSWRAKWITSVTWGSPRVGGRAWAKLFNELAPDSLRYVYRNDIVCRVPTAWMNFCHVTNKIHIGQGGSIIKRAIGDKNDHYPKKYFREIMETV